MVFTSIPVFTLLPSGNQNEHSIHDFLQITARTQGTGIQEPEICFQLLATWYTSQLSVQQSTSSPAPGSLEQRKDTRCRRFASKASNQQPSLVLLQWRAIYACSNDPPNHSTLAIVVVGSYTCERCRHLRTFKVVAYLLVTLKWCSGVVWEVLDAYGHSFLRVYLISYSSCY